MAKQKLAACGGDPVIAPGTIKPWPPIDKTDRERVLGSLDAHQPTVGPNYVALEKEFAEWQGVKHACFANSGTAALHMCVVACGLRAGDEVIVPAYTWPSSATCCLHHNVIPVFVDVDWVTMNIDIDKIEAAVTPRTKAIVAVHLHGLTIDMDRLMAVANKHKLRVIEDFCQSIGATFQGRKAGLFGHVAATSTNHNKCLVSGEGGFFISNDDELFEGGKTLWYFGERRPPEGSQEFYIYGMGWMYRSTDLVAAFARAQLTRLDDYVAQQQANAACLPECLQAVPHLILPQTPAGHTHTFYNYMTRFDMEALGHVDDAPAFRDKINKALNAEGASVGVWQGWLAPKMSAFAAKNAYGKGCPWSCQHAAEVDYSLDQFPVGQKHCDWHTGLTMPLRSPNGTDVAEKVGQAFRKVMENIDQVEKIDN